MCSSDLGLRIVGQAHGVGTHLDHQTHVLLMVLGAEGVARLGPLLVATYAVQRQVLPVKQEAQLGVDREVAQPQRLLHTVDLRPVAPQRRLGPVEEGIGRTVPQPGMLQHEVDPLLLRGRMRRDDDLLLGLVDRSLTVGDPQPHDRRLRPLRSVRQLDARAHLGAALADRLLDKEKTR